MPTNPGLEIVTTYYLDPVNGPTPLLPENSIMAGDVAGNWTAFRAAIVALGWEPYISPPGANEPEAGYTRGFFRTPDDQAYLVQTEGPDASPVDDSPHQAARAFDLDLNGMQAAFSDYDYDTVVSTAASYGFYPTASGEPWHFDDNVAANPNYGSVAAAVLAIGNTQAQVAADVAAGTPTPQQAAVSGSTTNTLLFVGAALALALWLMASIERQKKQPAEKPAETGGPQYAF